MPYGFGIGTVGNSGLTGFSFAGGFGGDNYAIAPTGGIMGKNFNNKFPQVEGMATFTFTISSGYSNDDIKRSAFFGLGSDASIASVPSDPPANNPAPEPTTMLLFGTGLAGLAAARRRKKAC